VVFPSLDPSVPGIVCLMTKLATSLGSLSDSLAAAGMVLAGPNLIQDQARDALRLWIWIVDPGFLHQPPEATHPLPYLNDQAVAASFALASPLPIPPRNLGDPHHFGPSFALSIPSTTLQEMAEPQGEARSWSTAASTFRAP
jgi:hypothetical protein